MELQPRLGFSAESMRFCFLTQARSLIPDPDIRWEERLKIPEELSAQE